MTTTPDQATPRDEVRPIWQRPLPLSVLLLIPNLALLALYHLPTPKRIVGDEGYYFNLGRAFANGDPVVHNPLWPPLYGDVLGSLFHLFGITVMPVQLIQIALWYSCGWLVFDMARKLGAAHIPALLAMLVFYLSPEVAAFSHYLWPEIPHLFFMLLGFWALFHNDQNLLSPLIAGISLAMALLTKLLLGPFIPVCILFLLLVSNGGWSRKALRAAVFIFAFGLTLAPTLIINNSRYGRPMIADSSIFNIWVGLKDTEKRDHINDIAGVEFQAFQQSGEGLDARNRVYRQKIIDHVKETGGAAIFWGQLTTQYFRLLSHDTFLTTQLSGGARSAYTYAGAANSGIRIWSNVYHILLMGLIMLCVSGLDWRRPKPSWLLALFLAYNAALFLLVHVKTRYMVQLIPIIIVCTLVTGKGGGLRDLIPSSKPRKLLGSLLVFLLLILAFV